MNRFLGIGLNYAGTSNALQGCVNDARDWLARFSPACAIATILLEQQATKAGIVSAISDLLASLTPGDCGIVTFSGHGTHLPDRDGDERDGQDEALCPWDLTRNLLLDDELKILLAQRAQGTRMLLITDCCHSGTIARSNDGERGLPRYIPFAELTNQGMCPQVIESLQQTARSVRGATTDDGLTHISGCSDAQFSYDATFGGKSNGAFTYFALRALQTAQKGVTCEQWHSMIRRDLPSNRYPQAPEINGTYSLVVPGFEVATQPTSPIGAETAEGVTNRGRKFRLEIQP